MPLYTIRWGIAGFYFLVTLLDFLNLMPCYNYHKEVKICDINAFSLIIQYLCFKLSLMKKSNIASSFRKFNPVKGIK